MEETKTAISSKEQLIQVIQFYLEQLDERELHMALGGVRGLSK